MDNTCEKYSNWIKDELAGELDADLETELRRHLEACAGCRRERKELGETIERLGALEEFPVPRHFFVYEDSPRRLGLAEAFRHLGLVWKLLTISAGVLLFAGGLLVASNARFTVADGSVTLVLGRMDPEPALDPEQFKAELVRLVGEGAAESRDREERLRKEVLDYLEQADKQAKDRIEIRLAELEGRLLESMNLGDRSLQAQLEISFNRFGRSILSQHQEDMGLIRKELMRFATFDRYQAGQANLILSRLNQMQETGIQKEGLE